MTKYDTKGAFEVLREDPFLPPVPAPRKSKGLGWIAAGVAAAIVAGGIGVAVSQNTVAENLGTKAAPIAGSVIAPSTDAVYAQAMDLNDQVISELDATAASTTPDEMAGHAYTAASLLAQESDLFTQINPTVAGYLSSASSHIAHAADAVTVGDFDTATSEVEMATSDIDAATASL